MPRSDALHFAAISRTVPAPSSIAVNTSSSSAAFIAAVRWCAKMVSKYNSGEGIVWTDMLISNGRGTRNETAGQITRNAKTSPEIFTRAQTRPFLEKKPVSLRAPIDYSIDFAASNMAFSFIRRSHVEVSSLASAQIHHVASPVIGIRALASRRPSNESPQSP
jgi:hypothetical protein